MPVEAERAFSSIFAIKLKSRLGDKIVNALIFLRSSKIKANLMHLLFVRLLLFVLLYSNAYGIIPVFFLVWRVKKRALRLRLTGSVE